MRSIIVTQDQIKSIKADWDEIMKTNGGDRTTSATILLAFHTARLADAQEGLLAIHKENMEIL